MRWMLVAVTVLVAGCPDDCVLNEFRCKGAVLQQCDSHGRWVEHTDCDELGPDWECCLGEDAAGGIDYSCFLAEECTGGDA